MLSTKRPISCDDSTREWKRLIREAGKICEENDVGKKANCDGEDPFDCGDVACPPLHAAVDSLLDDFVEEWRHLDGRKFAAEEKEKQGDDGGASENDNEAPKKTNQRRMRHADRPVLLPAKFDYKTERPEPPEDDGTGDRVISLEDPTKTLSYHQELWKLFASVPRLETLRAQYHAGAKLPHTKAMHDEIAASYQAYMRVDAHALGRLRLANQHAFPTTARSVLMNNDDASLETTTPIISTVRFECFRRLPKRGPQPDPCRLVLEFLSTQTLLDFHRAVVQLADDGLWENAMNAYNMAKDITDATTGTTLDCSGIFLIEDKLYTTGDVDYYGPIKEWIDGNHPPNDARRKYLGINAESSLDKVDMANVKLGKIPMRLATRYCHICHGDVETAVFLTDRRVARRERVPYPILHDRWGPMVNAPTCECCQHLPGMFVTNTTCTKSDGLRFLCEGCCKQLSLVDDDVQSYYVWKFQPDLSVSATKDSAL